MDGLGNSNAIPSTKITLTPDGIGENVDNLRSTSDEPLTLPASGRPGPSIKIDLTEPTALTSINVIIVAESTDFNYKYVI